MNYIFANDFEVTYNGKTSDAFTYKTWRDHQSIIINDCGNKSIEVEGKTWQGFSLVSLPNSTEISETANMPSGVWKYDNLMHCNTIA